MKQPFLATYSPMSSEAEKKYRVKRGINQQKLEAFSTGGVINPESLSDFLQSCRFSRIDLDELHKAAKRAFCPPQAIIELTRTAR